MPNFDHVQYAASGTVSKRLLKKRVHVVTQAGVVLALPTPDKNLSYLEPRTFTNASSGYVILSCPGYFLTGQDTIMIGPLESVKLQITETDATTYYWDAIGIYQRSDTMVPWTPVLTFTTATPTLTDESYEAWVKDGVVLGIGYAKTADGAGATALTVTLPIRPKDRDNFIPVVARCVVDGAYTEVQGYIESADSTNTNRVLKFNAFPTWTDNKTCEIWFAFFYEAVGDGWETFTPALTWGTSTPDTVATVARCKNIDGVMFWTEDNRSADAKGVTSSLATTVPTFPLDTAMYVPCLALDNCVAGDDSVDYDDMLMILDCDNATEASRVATSHAIGVCANGKAVQTYLAGIYEHYGWHSFTPVFDFTGTDPTAAALAGRYKVVDDICFFQIYYSTTDGNGCTALEVSGLPVSPKYASRKIPVRAIQLVDTTYSNAMGIIDADQAAAADRKLNFQNLSTFTDAVAGKMFIAGWYPVG